MLAGLILLLAKSVRAILLIFFSFPFGVFFVLPIVHRTSLVFFSYPLSYYYCSDDRLRAILLVIFSFPFGVFSVLPNVHRPSLVFFLYPFVVVTTGYFQKQSYPPRV